MTTQPQIEALEARADALSAELEQLVAIDNPTPGEQQRMTRQTAAAHTPAREIRDAKAERSNQVAELAKFAAMPGHIEHPAEPATSFNINRGAYANPWDHLRSGVVNPGDVRDRALAATERVNLDTVDADADATRQRMTVLVEGDQDPTLAAFALAVSSPDYASAFRKLVKNPSHGAAMLTDAERAAFAATQAPQLRAMSEATGAAGAFLVPFHLDPSVCSRMRGPRTPFAASPGSRRSRPTPGTASAPLV